MFSLPNLSEKSSNPEEDATQQGIQPADSAIALSSPQGLPQSSPQKSAGSPQQPLSRKQRQKEKRKARRTGKGITNLKSHRFPDCSEWFLTGSRLHRGIYLKNDSAMPDARQRLSQDLKAVTDKNGELEALRRYAGSIVVNLISTLIECSYSWCDCICLDFGDLQIKCHAPKGGNPNISFEFYGSVSSDCFGYDYTPVESSRILVAFFDSRIGRGKIYQQHWRNILKAADVESRAAFDREVAQ